MNILQSINPPSFDEQVQEWARWLANRRAASPGSRAHFVSVTFDRYRDRYFRDGPPRGMRPATVTREDVITGQTLRLSNEDAARAFISDVNRWYLRLLHSLFGGRYAHHRDNHPFGVGWIDQPAAKRAHFLNEGKLLPGVEFPNAHFFLVVPHMRYASGPDSNTLDRFDRLWQQGFLDKEWRRWNPQGDLHVGFVHALEKAFRYAAKTARRDKHLQDHMIMLPFA